MKFCGSLFLFIINLNVTYTWPATASDNLHDFETEYLCIKKHCARVFTTERECLYHFIKEHVSQEKIMCPFKKCMHSFEKERYLDAHIEREHKTFMCNLCKDEIKYKNFDEFKIHLQQYHMSN